MRTKRALRALLDRGGPDFLKSDMSDLSKNAPIGATIGAFPAICATLHESANGHVRHENNDPFCLAETDL